MTHVQQARVRRLRQQEATLSRAEATAPRSVLQQPAERRIWRPTAEGTAEETCAPERCRWNVGTPVPRESVLALIREYALGVEPPQLGLVHGICGEASAWLVQRGPRPECSTRCLACVVIP